jgi:hypothetical protein
LSKSMRKITRVIVAEAPRQADQNAILGPPADSGFDNLRPAPRWRMDSEDEGF